MVSIESIQLVCLSLGPIFVVLGIALLLAQRAYAKMNLSQREVTVIALGAADLVLASWVGLSTFS
jgi:hypothetical protein